MRLVTLAICVTLLMLQLGCTPSPKSGKGFTLPDGDIARGQATFERLQCNACHTVEGVESDSPTTSETEPKKAIALGGKVYRIQTYGELVTSIINPSHRLASGYSPEEISTDGVSKMKNYNDVMTVAELSDLVTFLQSKYELMPYEPTDYPEYGP